MAVKIPEGNLSLETVRTKIFLEIIFFIKWLMFCDDKCLYLMKAKCVHEIQDIPNHSIKSIN